MSQILFQVDAFTDKPFSGNPAAVCILEKAADETWMQNIALENNLSETAYLYPEKDGFNLRWFTPAVEVELCGHATLASSHILWEQGILSPDKEAVFYTKSGELRARKVQNGIELNFPSTPSRDYPAPVGLLEAFGVNAIFVGKNKFDYLIEVASEDIVRNLQPDFNLLSKLQVRGVIVTAKSSSDKYDIVSRFFAPGAGVNEDPVTGSAHCTLCPYWTKKLGKPEIKAYQASKRGGELVISMDKDRVRLVGKAVTIMKLELML